MIDWKLAIFILNGFVLFTNLIIYCSIKFNDLKHLTERVNKLEQKEEKNKKEVLKAISNFRKSFNRWIRKIVELDTIINEWKRKNGN